MAFGADLLGPMHRRQVLEFKIRSGFQTPAEVIRSAMTIAAELFQMAGEIGAISVGARADLIAVQGDPPADLGVLPEPDRYLDFVAKDGRICKDGSDAIRRPAPSKERNRHGACFDSIMGLWRQTLRRSLRDPEP